MLKSIIKWSFIVVITLVLGITAAIFIFKDRIVEQVIAEVNKNLAVPIAVSKVDIEILHGFPNMAVVFYDIVLPADADEPLLEAKKLYILLNPFTIFQGELKADVLEVEDAKLFILVDKQNKSNLTTIFKRPEEDQDSTAANNAISLKSILLKRIKVDYRNLYSGAEQQYTIDQLSGNIDFSDQVVATAIEGSVTLNKLSTKTWTSRFPRALELDIDLAYNLEQKSLLLHQSTIKHYNATFNLSGELNFARQPYVNVSLEGSKVSFKLLSSFLPIKHANLMRKYESSGTIDFNATLKGDITPKKLPALTARFVFKKVDLTDKEYDANIHNLNLESDIRFTDIGNLASGSVKIANATGELDGRPFTFDLAASNFVRPTYKLKFDGDIATSWLLAAIQFPYSQSGKGQVSAGIAVSGKQNSKGEVIESNISGSFNLVNVSFQWADTISIDRVGGTILLNGDMLSISDLKINWLQSNLVVNGSVEDIMTDLSGSMGQILLQSDVKSSNLAIEDIIALIKTIPEIPRDSAASPLGLDLQLTCVFDNLSFRRYQGKAITGEILYQDNVIEVMNLNGKGMGGGVMVDGKLYILPNADFYIDSQVKTSGVYLDSMFYVFENFGQDFITDKDLRGKLFASVNSTMFFDSTWRFRRKLLRAEAKVRIENGELRDFEPIMALAAYIDEKDDNLANVRFSDLTNYITIREDTVFIPEMSIHTNVRNIALGGYHTLTQHINYQLAVPIFVDERLDKDEVFGAIQKSAHGSPNLLFKITGTTSDFKVSFDVKRATGNVLRLLDLTRIFRKKEEELTDSTFLDDDEFEWQN